MEKRQLIIRKTGSRGSFLQAFKAVFSSMKMVKQYKLYGYFIIPFLLNIIILSAIFYFSYINLTPLLEGLVTGDGIVFDALRFIIKPLIIIIQLILTILIYSIVGTIITSPFNDILSEKLEEKISGQKFNEKFSLSAALSDIARVIRNIVKLLIAIAAINIALLLLTFIPFFGAVLYTVLSLLVTIFFLGFQFYDFPLERRRQTFGEKLKTLLYFKTQTLGVGAAFFLLSYIPIIGFLGLNMATIGATSMFVEHIKPAITFEPR